jgi:ABC-type Fe3+ transport system substrate-binding protein
MSEFESARSTRTVISAIVVIAIVATGAVTVVFLSGILNPSGDGSTTTTTTTTDADSKVLTIITRHDISIHGVFEPAFLASDFAVENNIVDLKWKTPDGSLWGEVLDGGTIDVAWGGGPTLFDQLMRDNRLQPLTSSLMTEVAGRINDTIAGADMKRNNTSDELMWIAAAISSFGFTVNYAFLDDYNLPVPYKWTDLANITYGKNLPGLPSIAMGNAPQTTSNTRIYEIIVQALGWDQGWITMSRMAGNAGIYPGSVETQNAVENGDVGVAMSIDFYGYLTQFKNPDCFYIVPEGQTIVNGDPIAIPINAPQPALAEGFIDYVLSAEGQALWLDSDVRRMPVMREAFDEPGAPEDLYLAFNQTIQTAGIDFNDTLSLVTNAAFVPYFGAVFADAHTELVDCWNTILTAYNQSVIDEADVAYYAGLMGTPVSIIDPKTLILSVFSQEYAIAINNDMIYDASYASTVTTRWTAAAKIQYLDVKNQVLAL